LLKEILKRTRKGGGGIAEKKKGKEKDHRKKQLGLAYLSVLLRICCLIDGFMEISKRVWKVFVCLC